MDSPVPVNKYLIVARHQEDVDAWIGHVSGDWQRIIIQKGVDMPNVGREASSYFHGILSIYDKLQDLDLVMCVQGRAIDHIAVSALKEVLATGTDGFKWIGIDHHCDGTGSPDHPGLPIAAMYREFTGKTMDCKLLFTAGGQFVVTGKLIKKRDKEDYQMLMKLMEEGQMPWAMERLWESLFCGN